MLGSSARAKVVKTAGQKRPDGFVYPLNMGKIYDTEKNEYAFLLGVDHPVKNFDGRIVAKLELRDQKWMHYWVIAPKSRKYINNVEIMQALDYEKNFSDCDLICYYEHSAGAVTYTFIKGVPHFLLIKNKNSVNYGFPKGHMEKGETEIQTAKREVFEETGIKIQLHDGFEIDSEYTANHTVKKLVSFFVGFSRNTRVIMQEEEISDFIWLPYTEAKRALTFRNDKKVLAHARQFLIAEGIIEVLEDQHSLRKIEKGHGRNKKKSAKPAVTVTISENETAQTETENTAEPANEIQESTENTDTAVVTETEAVAEESTAVEAAETAVAEALENAEEEIEALIADDTAEKAETEEAAETVEETIEEAAETAADSEDNHTDEDTQGAD